MPMPSPFKGLYRVGGTRLGKFTSCFFFKTLENKLLIVVSFLCRLLDGKATPIQTRKQPYNTSRLANVIENLSD
jgi:hypothetical protein